MPHLIKPILMFCFLALAVAGSTPKVGERAPQFSLPSTNGATVALKDYAGRKLVLVFYRGYW